MENIGKNSYSTKYWLSEGDKDSLNILNLQNKLRFLIYKRNKIKLRLIINNS